MSVTTNVALVVDVPPGPVACAVYTVVTLGDTGIDPDGAATDPIPLMLIEVAFAEVQERVATLPAPNIMLVGVRDNEIFGKGGATCNVTDLLMFPPGPVAVAV